MNNIQGGDVTCYIREVQALAPQFSNSPWTPLAKDLPGLIYHQRAQSNEFWLRAATRTVFLTIRHAFSLNIRGSDGFVTAADSKVTYKGNGINGPTTACKIYRSGSLHFAIAGMRFLAS